MITSDKNGNKIITRKKKDKISYYLILKSEKYPRRLGYMKDGIFYIRKNPDIHLFEKLDAYGFNETLVGKILEDRTPIIFTVKGIKEKYLIWPERIMHNKKTYLNFSKDGLELQLFVEWDKIRENFKMENHIKDSDGKKIVDIDIEEENEIAEEEKVDWKELAKEV